MSRSRSNNDKPFYVDIGTSIVAIRCASNHDVIERYNHVSNKGVLKLAEEICDRMNKEAEISRPLRNCDLGTAEEQDSRHSNWCRKYWRDVRRLRLQGRLRCYDAR